MRDFFPSCRTAGRAMLGRESGRPPGPDAREHEMAVKDDARHIVVVGVDGSPESRIAAGYALDEATRREAELRVVAVAPVPDYRSVAYGFERLLSPDKILAGVRDAARKLIDE